MPFIKYNKANIHTIGVMNPGQGMVQSIVLKPGVNQLSAAEWAAIKYHPDMKRMLEADDVEVVGKETDNTSDLAKMDANKAVKMVGETLDHVVLVKWYAAESRDEVKAAIKMQLEKLNVDVDGKALVIDKKKEK